MKQKKKLILKMILLNDLAASINILSILENNRKLEFLQSWPTSNNKSKLQLIKLSRQRIRNVKFVMC